MRSGDLLLRGETGYIFFTIWRTCSDRGNAEDGTYGGIDCFEEKPRLDQTKASRSGGRTAKANFCLGC